MGDGSSSVNVSPESSTHPVAEVSLCPNKSPENEDFDSGVSSTTKELDLMKNTLQPLKPLKKEVDPFGLLKDSKKSATEDPKVHAKLETTVLFAPTILPTSKTTSKDEPTTKVKDKKYESTTSTKESSSHRSSSKEHRHHSSSHGHHGHHHSSSKDHRKSSSSSHMTKKIKEMKDKDLKDLFAATDTIPNHTKKEAKATTNRKPSEGSETKKKDH